MYIKGDNKTTLIVNFSTIMYFYEEVPYNYLLTYSKQGQKSIPTHVLFNKTGFKTAVKREHILLTMKFLTLRMIMQNQEAKI